jgi:hypothetical protein
VFNHLNESKDFYLFLKNIDGYLFATIIQNHNNYIDNNRKFVNVKNVGKVEKCENKKFVKLELWRYFNPTGPPLTC